MTGGLFITFEGGEGSGKTTQINALSNFLHAKHYKSITTREPGGTPESEKIRNLLVKRDGGHWSPESEILLLYAARSMHVQHVIKPALAEGKIVICDRFSDSTIAYQGYGHGYPIETIHALDNLIMQGFKPDLTFILDIDPEKGIARSMKRMENTSSTFERLEDRFEKLDLSFHTKLREGFLEIAKQNPQRCHIINAEQPIDSVTENIKTLTLRAIEGRGA